MGSIWRMLWSSLHLKMYWKYIWRMLWSSLVLLQHCCFAFLSFSPFTHDHQSDRAVYYSGPNVQIQHWILFFLSYIVYQYVLSALDNVLNYLVWIWNSPFQYPDTKKAYQRRFWKSRGNLVWKKDFSGKTSVVISYLITFKLSIKCQWFRWILRKKPF